MPQTRNEFIDPNNIDYRDSWPSSGVIYAIGHEAPQISVSGTIAAAPSGSALLVVDSYRRFVFARITASGPFAFFIPDKHLQTSSWPLRFYLYNPVTNVAAPLTLDPAAEAFAGKIVDIPSMRERNIETLRLAMGRTYTSISSTDEIKTGNNYQSIDLDTTLIAGGRPSRNMFFNHIDFRGKRVLDIGANMGESSRLARRRGADLVDGYEYDPFFVETGRMINAVSGATRVSLFQGDATNRALYHGMKYDLVIAFSVWVYIHHLLDRIAEITDVVFFETHTLDHGLDMYVKPMSQHFPAYRVVGYEHQQNMKQSRCVLLFAKTQEQLDGALRLVNLKVEPYFENAFFDVHPTTTPADFERYAEDMAARVTDDSSFDGIGRTYFELLIAGYAAYKKSGTVARDNIFVRNFRNAIADGRIDPNLKHMLDNEERLLEKVDKKFLDMDHAIAGRSNMIAPLVLLRGNNENHVFTGSDGARHPVESLDGHHRFFMAQLLGQQTIDALVSDPLPAQRDFVYRIEG